MPIENLLTLYTSVRLFVVLKVVGSLTNSPGVIFHEVIQRSRKKDYLTPIGKKSQLFSQFCTQHSSECRGKDGSSNSYKVSKKE